MGTEFMGDWRRPLTRSREIRQSEELARFYETFTLENGEDKWFWSLDSSGSFIMGSLRAAIDDMCLKK